MAQPKFTLKETICGTYILQMMISVDGMVSGPQGELDWISSDEQLERRHGVLSIAALSDQIGISQKHLGTQFKQMVGVLPKELARFYRFAHVLDSIDPTKPTDWTQIVRRCGYHDQSHLYKEFVAFTGHSPTDYLSIRHRAYDDNPEQAQSLGLGQMLVG
jgi:AraC-like DNA-binding protein